MIDLKTGLIGGSGSSGGSHDLVIAGGGPAALSAGIYAGRYLLDHLILESYEPGGQTALTAKIENYPGILSIEGGKLASIMRKQAEQSGSRFANGVVSNASLDRESGIRLDTTAGEYRCRSLIIATGAAPKPLGVPGEKKLHGRGVSYCATCDAPFFKGQHVLVVGGGDSAIKEALHLVDYAEKVTIVHRRDELRAEPILAKKILGHPRAEVLWSTILTEIRGETGVEKVLLETSESAEELDVDGVFIYVGREPATGPFENLVALSPDGTIKTTDSVFTSTPGVFAAGDVTDNGLRQIVTAAADGARAATAAYDFLSDTGS